MVTYPPAQPPCRTAWPSQEPALSVLLIDGYSNSETGLEATDLWSAYDFAFSISRMLF